MGKDMFHADSYVVDKVLNLKVLFEGFVKLPSQAKPGSCLFSKELQHILGNTRNISSATRAPPKLS